MPSGTKRLRSLFYLKCFLVVVLLFNFFPLNIYPETKSSLPIKKKIIIKSLAFTEISGKHIRLYYRGNKQEAMKTLRELERFHESYYHRFFGSDMGPASIILYRTKKEYIKHEGLTQEYFAHYSTRTGKVYSFMGEDLGPLFHESVHAWIEHNMKGLVRLWFNEGFASLFESPAKTDKETWKFDNPNWRHTKLKDQWTPLKTFMNRVDLQDGHDKAQARLIFIYLSRKVKLEEYVKKYHENLDLDASGIMAIEEVTGKPLEKINQDMKEFKERLFDEMEEK